MVWCGVAWREEEVEGGREEEREGRGRRERTHFTKKEGNKHGARVQSIGTQEGQDSTRHLLLLRHAIS